MDNGWVHITEAAERLGLTERALHYRISKGTIESKMENGKRYVLLDSEEFHRNSSENTEESSDEFHRNFQMLLDEKDARIADLHKQLEESNRLLDQAQKLVAIESNNVAMLTGQLKDSQLMLEDLRDKKPFWRRLFRRG